jgi:electron transport complex protein RnfG
MKKILKNTLALTLITLVLGLVLGLVHEVTLEPIAAQERMKKEEAYAEVLPGAASFEELDLAEGGLGDRLNEAAAEVGLTAETIDGAAEGLDENGSPAGYVLTVTTGEGYGGDITFTMGITEDGTLQGISFLTIEETAGLGMRADTEEFKSQFAGKKTDSISYTKTGASSENEIDAISGATVTTNAVTNGVNAGLAAFRALTEGGQS